MLKNNANAFKILVLILLMFPTAQTVARYDARPPCFKAFERNFFDPEIVSQALNMHRVYQSTWMPIINELQQRSRDVPRLMKNAVDIRGPNPFTHPFDAVQAKKILRQVLYEIFYRTLVTFSNVQTADIGDMFNYIWLRQQDAIDSCLDEFIDKEAEQQELNPLQGIDKDDFIQEEKEQFESTEEIKNNLE